MAVCDPGGKDTDDLCVHAAWQILYILSHAVTYNLYDSVGECASKRRTRHCQHGAEM